MLADVRTIFGDSIALHTKTVLERLCNGPDSGLDDDAPWADLRGKALGVRGLATMLKRYGVQSIRVKVDGLSLQGYRREHLWDAWQRYLLPRSAKMEPVEPGNGAPSPGERVTSGTYVTRPVSGADLKAVEIEL